MPCRKACKTPQINANKDAKASNQTRKNWSFRGNEEIEKSKKYGNIFRKKARIFAFIKPPLLLLLKRSSMTYAML
jgi:hypothetical protein